MLMKNQPNRKRRKPSGGANRQARQPSQEKKSTHSIPPKEVEEYVKRAKARCELYEIFSLLYQEVPSPELLAIFRHSGFMDIIRALLPPEHHEKWQKFAGRKMPLDHLHARLRLEYNNLFLLPTSQRIVPRISTFYFEPRKPELAKRRLDDIQKFYRRIGMTPMAKFKDQPDHLSQIMHFMSVLCEREKDYLEKKNLGQLESACQLQVDFMNRHLADWIPLFEERMRLSTRFLFFRDMAELMKQFIELEIQWMQGMQARYGLKSKPPAQEKPEKQKPTQSQEKTSLPSGEKRSSRRRRGGRRRRRPGRDGDATARGNNAAR